MADIISFDQATISELREKKILRETEEFVQLDYAGPGEKVIGELNDFERPLFVEYVTLEAELSEQRKELAARGYEQFAAAIRDTPINSDILKNLDPNKLFPSPEEAEEFYELTTRVETLRALYNASIRSRFGHSIVLGVRADYKVVRVRLKYDTAADLRAANGIQG